MDNNLENIRHSTSHLLAAAVKKIYPEAKFGIGPAIETGFYYDFDLADKLKSEMLPQIEQEMKKIKELNLEISGKEVSYGEAKKIFKKLKQPYKLELIDDLEKKGEKVTVYTLGDFTDLCRGGHVKNTKELGAFKLTSVAGAYWKGSEKNKMLQRIYGMAFSAQKELEEFLQREEEAKKRDHRILGEELDLFSFHEEAPGFVFWHAKGNFIKNAVIGHLKNILEQNGYDEISTPLMLSEDLWHQSGHWEHYKDNMYFTGREEKNFALKPMNCPGAAIIFRSKIRSYKDLPLRLSEFGIVHRHELSGTLSGLFRVRGFTQDDAHIFCANEQIEGEISKLVKIAQKVYRDLGFKKYEVEFSTRPDDYMGDLKMWNSAESALENTLKKLKINYKINKSEGAFYGPKIDFHIKDAIGRTWQCATIQLDFQMPERFNLNYIDKKGGKTRPAIIHRTILGSLERFIAVLIENYNGALPLWLSPVQARIATVGKDHKNAALKLKKMFGEQGLRAEVDASNSTVGYKIRESELKKIPFAIVVGDKEKSLKKIAVRRLGSKKIESMSPKKFIELCLSTKL